MAYEKLELKIGMLSERRGKSKVSQVCQNPGRVKLLPATVHKCNPFPHFSSQRNHFCQHSKRNFFQANQPYLLFTFPLQLLVKVITIIIIIIFMIIIIIITIVEIEIFWDADKRLILTLLVRQVGGMTCAIFDKLPQFSTVFRRFVILQEYQWRF